ncbi:MAG: hypothetical protein NXI10_06805 [bacterium]|nr:hypothetical protein [bacterium]
MRFIVAFVFLVPFIGLTQNTGLYGKKTILEVQGHGSWPVLNGWFNSFAFYKRSGTTLREGRNIFDSGVRINVMRAFNNQFGLGLEYGLEFQNVASTNIIELGFSSSSFDYTSFQEIRHEAVNMRSFSIMPKFEFSSKTNLLPIGLSHQLGIGFTSTRLLEKDYLYDVTISSNDSLTTPLTGSLIDYTDQWLGFTVMYQINMRTPITDMIMITYGLRYNANFVRRYPENPNPAGQLDIDNIVKEKRNETFFQLHVGAAVAF